MVKYKNSSTAAYYNYTAGGERNIKLTAPRLDMRQNAEMLANPMLVYPTLYASPLVTLTQHGYTKHYFEEGRRICSKIGGGMQGNVAEQEIDDRVEGYALGYEDQFYRQHDGILQTFNECIGVEPQIVEEADLRRMLVEQELQRDESEPAFYYHGDHLGSAAYLTSQGQVTQTLNYLPYGEDWVEQNFFQPHDTTRLGIYRFNGKEKDYESGFHYYGARYYWSEVLTGWLSVDPMMDKYPGMSPYNYCAWNPVKLIDPDGRDWYQNVYSGAVYYNSDIHGDKCAGTGDMKGNGWVLLGENDMFKENENDISHSGLTLAASNGGSINQVLDNPYDFSERNTHIRCELMLEGDKAENFMKSQGYKKMPLLAKVNVMIVKQNISEGDGSVYVQKDDQSYVSKVYSTTYVKNPPRNPRYSVKKTTPWKDDINIVRSISSRTEIRQYDYSRGNNWDIIEAGLSIIARLMSGL